ncbi:protein ycf2 [Phtheirospermum japonicum]|uniref:Protein ycf2 n=1 Tax=Phtheirospermum japonicum TaxID=374723 RepID=A0A830C705_9LAMI|nr:protein ycf2 [Phtheirospermum japonicum]
MILRMDNSSISCSFATKYFLCASVKKKHAFGGEILFHQSSSVDRLSSRSKLPAVDRLQC